MPAQLLDGVAVANAIKEEVAQEVKALSDRGLRPGLAAVLVGDNPSSQIYVSSKVKSCETLGIYSEKHELPQTTTTEQLLELVDMLNESDLIDGILVQLPLPKQIDTAKILLSVDPAKDVDGFHPMNVGKLYLNQETLAPCTPSGIIEMLNYYRIEIQGKRAVVLGRSDIVGKPMAMLLLHRHATVTICHSRTADLPSVTREADILVAAIGRAAMVTADFVKPGAVVVDVGMNKLSSIDEVRAVFGEDEKRLGELQRKGYTLVGDVNPKSVAPVAGYLTPVPGGVGPLTIAMLMKNTVKAARMRRLNE